MKVLFAVSNEEISESVVKRYQREYKEIISYKNVYFFNAILKEIQKDKSYDRIVISEDLEVFTHTQYDQIDKFLFEKLDSISDEASNAKGDDIPIILICSDRRTKSEQILSKLFGIGIYNAIIGNDRSVEEVCNLIRKPRSKKEAKIYYKIDTEEVGYEKEDKNEVSETEMQNILAHYKRLGKDEEKYVQSFDSIAAQYNDTQLRIICRYLPLNVRAVLEEKSEKYQKLMAFNSKVSETLRKPKKEQKDTEGHTEKLLKPKIREINMSKPVVIPSEVNMQGNKKLSKNKQGKINIETQESTIKEKNQENKINEKNAQNKLQTVEPQKNTEIPKEQIEESVNVLDTSSNENQASAKIEESVKPVKRGRGRPKKNPEPIENKPKRGRGRPKKVSMQNEENISLPGFETIKENKDTSENILPGFEDDILESVTPEAKRDTYQNETILPGFENEEISQEENILPGFEEDFENSSQNYKKYQDTPSDYEENESNILPGFEEDEDEDTSEELEQEKNTSSTTENENIMPGLENSRNIVEPSSNQNYYTSRAQELLKPKVNENIDIANLITSDKKIVCFVGTSKNGTSFIVNNIAQILSARGIDTAILDATKNRNSYYIYTKNEEELRNIASTTLENLVYGSAEGIDAGKNLKVYTSMPTNDDPINNSREILQTLIQKHSCILIDCDFTTPVDYFKQAQEIYLVQSLDVLTIQPLTAFLRELKAQNILEERKIKIVLNKAIKVKGVNERAIIGGMAFYNDPSMSFMTELFDRNIVKYISIPFSEEVYSRYLSSLVECEISQKGYPKYIMQALNELANMVYPVVSGKSTYKPPTAKKVPTFTQSMNSTLDQMRKY